MMMSSMQDSGARKGTISIVVPVYNEGAQVVVAFKAISAAIESSGRFDDYEIIFVDDGSHDDSFRHLEELARNSAHVRAIKLARNCGSHMAIRAGLDHATGTMACFLACDLQDPPEMIPRMADALVDSIQVVWAVRASREDDRSSQLFAKLFYWLARRLVSKEFPPTGASMFLLGQEALRAVTLHPERNLTLEGLLATIGFKQTYVSYERRSRTSGKSKWTLTKRLKLFADFFVGYSYAPIRFMSYLGIGVAVVGFLYAIYIFLSKVVHGIEVPGWTSLMVVVLLLAGVQLLVIGIIGEYVWRALDEIRARPRYLIERMVGREAIPAEADLPAISGRRR